MSPDINLIAVLLAAVASIVVGILWYGVFFKKSWMRMMGFTAESVASMKMTASMAYLLQFVASLAMAYVLARFLVYSNVYYEGAGLSAGLAAGFWAWLGFVAPVTLGVVMWEGKPWKLWFINASNFLVSLLAMGAILALLG